MKEAMCRHLSCSKAKSLFPLPPDSNDFVCPFPSIPDMGTDLRDALLERVIAHIRLSTSNPHEVKQAQLVLSTVEAVLNSSIESDEIAAFLKLNSAASVSINSSSAQTLQNGILSCLATMNKLLVVSIGAGGAELEKRIDSMLSDESRAKVNWLLCDPSYNQLLPDLEGASRSRWNVEKIGFSETLKSTVNRYSKSLGDPLYFANFSLHHSTSDSSTVERFFSETRFVIVEEPTTEVEWSSVPHRLVRTAFEILANVAYQPKWAESFLVRPSEFNFNPILEDAFLGLKAILEPIANTSPRAVVMRSPTFRC